MHVLYVLQPEENIFASAANTTTATESTQDITNREVDGTAVRARMPASASSSSNSGGGGGVLGRVEAEQSRWMRKVEEQRRGVFTDHTMLN